jgi:hypothetical protein
LAWEHEDERDGELRAALDEAGFKNWDIENRLRGLDLKNITLTAAETNALYELQKNLQSKLRNLAEANQKGEIDGAGFADAQNKAQADFDQQMKALLAIGFKGGITRV